MPDLKSHPIRDLVAAGVRVSVNTDDPPMFATNLNAEYAIAARLLDLNQRGVADLARTAVESSFRDDAGKRRLLAEIDAYAAAALEHPVRHMPNRLYLAR